MGTEMAESLLNDSELAISTVTTDGDAELYLGVKDCYTDKGIESQVYNDRDPAHIGMSQRKSIMRMKFHNWDSPLPKSTTHWIVNKVSQKAMQEAIEQQATQQVTTSTSPQAIEQQQATTSTQQATTSTLPQATTSQVKKTNPKSTKKTHLLMTH